MIRNVFVTFILCFVISSAVGADEFSANVYILHEGDNTISLSIKNEWNRDIRNLKVISGFEVLPSWIELAANEEPVTILAGENGESTLTFTLTVTHPPEMEYADIKVLFGDDAGNLWSVPLSVSIDGLNGGPHIYETSLSANFPNPFNPTTTIPYSIAASTHVEMTIYNVLAQKVRTLIDANQSPGAYSVLWDGLDEQGLSVPSGIYFCRFTAGSHRSVQRMILVE